VIGLIKPEPKLSGPEPSPGKGGAAHVRDQIRR
jgi:hypothetical protein